MFDLKTGLLELTKNRISNCEVYEVVVEGYIGSQWSDWFDDMSLTSLPDGRTLISGCITDQAALHGLIARIRDLNLVLIQLRRIEI